MREQWGSRAQVAVLDELESQVAANAAWSVNMAQLVEAARSAGFSDEQIAEVLGVHRNTLANRFGVRSRPRGLRRIKVLPEQRRPVLVEAL
jgi:hypothetical protein